MLCSNFQAAYWEYRFDELLKQEMAKIAQAEEEEREE